jgi:hypothetical protein
VHDDIVEIAQRRAVSDGQHGDSCHVACAVQLYLAIRAHLQSSIIHHLSMQWFAAYYIHRHSFQIVTYKL